MALAFHFLGSPQLISENLLVSVHRRSVVALLAYLSVEDHGRARQTHTRESLSALLWPDTEQAKAFTNLRHTLWEIQKTFGQELLITNRETISLHADSNLWVDVQRFESLLLEGSTQNDVALRISLLAESVQLYRHHFLTGFTLKNAPTFSDWSQSKSDEMRLKLMQALTMLADDYCMLGRAEAAIPYARRRVELDRLNESAHRQLMQVYLQAGQHSAALKQYQACEQILRKELNLDPQPETRELYKQIRKGEVKHTQPAVQKQTTIPHNNLPHRLTIFIGREQERAEIMDLLATHRLVTLIGAGGVGKSRLSQQVGAEVLAHYPDGVWFVELAPLADPNLIPQIILSVLRFGEQPGKTPLQVLEEQLSSKKMLLIIDNCEHLIEASAKITHALLMSAPELKVFATSREALGVEGELVWTVPSLTIPDLQSLGDIEQLTQYESVRLFIDRALLVQPHFNVDQNAVHTIAQICSRLDGIPLAIELAAARVKALTVDQIYKRLNDCFRLLTGGSRTGLERHQTLRATIDWSYNLLAADEKKLLRRLSAFMGSWTLEAAEQVCIKESGEFDVLGALMYLIDKSLVVTDGSAHEARYHLLETTRQYAREKLVEAEEDELLHNQHLAYFLALAENGYREITGPDQAEVIELLDAEHDNFRIALEWCYLKQYTESALKMLGALGWAWAMSGYFSEARSWFDKLRVRGDLADYPEAYARVLNHIGNFATDVFQTSDARPILDEALEIWLKLGSQAEYGLADALIFLGITFDHAGSLDDAESLYKRSLEVSQRCGNHRVQAASMMFLGGIEATRGNLTSAQNLLEQGLEFAEKNGDLFSIALGSVNLGSFFVDRGNYPKARLLFDRQLKVIERLKFRFGLVQGLSSSGDLYHREGDYIQAEQCFEKSLIASRDLGMKGSTCFSLYMLSLLALHQNDYSSAVSRFGKYIEYARAIDEKLCLSRFFTGMSAVAGGADQPERCAKLFGTAQAIFDTIDYRIPQFDRTEFDRHIQIARDQLGSAVFDTLSKEGWSMTVELAIELTMEIKMTKLLFPYPVKTL